MDNFVTVSLSVAGLESTITRKLLVNNGVAVEKASTVVRRGRFRMPSLSLSRETLKRTNSKWKCLPVQLQLTLGAMTQR